MLITIRLLTSTLHGFVGFEEIYRRLAPRDIAELRRLRKQGTTFQKMGPTIRGLGVDPAELSSRLTPFAVTSLVRKRPELDTVIFEHTGCY
jgi:hypothetical protein